MVSKTVALFGKLTFYLPTTFYSFDKANRANVNVYLEYRQSIFKFEFLDSNEPSQSLSKTNATFKNDRNEITGECAGGLPPKLAVKLALNRLVLG